MYPLKFTPILKDKIWGGQKLEELFNKVPGDLPNIGESWEVSGYKSEVSVVSNGYLKGKTLQDLLETYKEQFVGSRVFSRFGESFPLLFKLIHANDDLSIQVHPNDEFAMKNHGTYGKTEMWYVLYAEPNAEIIIGFNKNYSKKQYSEALEQGDLERLMRRIQVKPGDCFYIPAGLVHAIGKGVIVAEIQQSSDATYRIFDYNRKDDQGKERELHTDLALNAINFKATKNSKVNYIPKLNEPIELVKCNYFTANLIDFDKKLTLPYNLTETFVVYMCIEGSLEISGGTLTVPVQKGESVMLPAGMKYPTLIPTGRAKVLEVYI
ncbi:MAG: class I mannose-6-phosphate isomerase [Porphyromonadaceae bacterium]|nr:class I mannose-6-phosphate isomerase [Porphyromonadaceae bacterium]